MRDNVSIERPFLIKRKGVRANSCRERATTKSSELRKDLSHKQHLLLNHSWLPSWIHLLNRFDGDDDDDWWMIMEITDRLMETMTKTAMMIIDDDNNGEDW